MEKDAFSRIFNVGGTRFFLSSIAGYKEMKNSNMYVSPDGEHCLLIGEKGTLFGCSSARIAYSTCILLRQ